MKVGIVLFCKNESYDISHWISWHLSLGANRIFVFDDGSNDGTRKILKTIVSTDKRVSIHSTGHRNHFADRQADVFLSALDLSCDEALDWVGFIDTDEYIDLVRYRNFQDFFEQITDYNGIALSWKCYGSGGNLVRPNPIVFESYRNFLPSDRGENFAVKSFVRPDFVRKKYLNPHVFEIDGPYGNARNEPADLDGFMLAPPVWDAPYVRHYITRSLSHYLDKISQRPDLRERPDPLEFFWQFQNGTAIEAPFNYEKFPFLKELRKIRHAIHREEYRTICADECDEKFLEERYKNTPTHLVGNYTLTDGIRIFYRRDSGTIFTSNQTQNRQTCGEIRIFSSPIHENIVFFTSETGQDLIKFDGQDLYTSFIGLNLKRSDCGNHYYFIYPQNGMIISFNRDNTGSSSVEANRLYPREWEQIDIKWASVYEETFVGQAMCVMSCGFRIFREEFLDLFSAWKVARLPNESVIPRNTLRIL
jgi:glycosyltransferase involved in cell wall biosynthesis